MFAACGGNRAGELNRILNTCKQRTTPHAISNDKERTSVEDACLCVVWLGRAGRSCHATPRVLASRTQHINSIHKKKRFVHREKKRKERERETDRQREEREREIER